ALRNWWAKLPANKREVFLEFIRRHRLKLLAGVGLVLASFAYYYFSHIQETPITKRRRFIAFTPEQFEVLNKLEFDQQIETYKSKLLPTEHADTQRVGRVVRQLLAGNEDIEQIKRHDWSVSVINDESVMNAFVMPSGNIFVFSGLLKMVDNDDQLGMILAHEISHAILGHGLENISHQHIVDIVFISLLGFLWMFLPSDLIAAIGTAFSRFILGISFMTPYSKMLETEADEVGLMLAAKACFDVREASAFWHKMAIISGADPVHQLQSSVEFLATHPSHEKRSEHLDGLLAEALKCRDGCHCSALPKEDPRERVQRMRDQIIRLNKDKNIEGVLKI
ncbi:PREDICTED: metalloendopeptidase OMA1, mitochondrial-like, partial [Rhagoletis zephyria]|uniref:metalloendopeptidase OMA1, mitochondrial-like n=1 Tax=Rhagoletis zephyria TaxID=28612 RepID=UPI0008113BC9